MTMQTPAADALGSFRNYVAAFRWVMAYLTFEKHSDNIHKAW
jgi:hypothetical protein